MALWGNEKENTTIENQLGKTWVTGAQLLVRFLESKGVKHLYGIPGAAILPVYDAVLEGGEIKSYNVRHEQTAIFMADGYYRATGKVGVCACTSGPGATNFLTGLYSAYADSTPLIAITGQVPMGLIGKDAFQEAPIVEMARPVTKASYLIKDVNELLSLLPEAWKKATTGRRGPILLDFPLDVQKSKIEVDVDQWLKQESPVEITPVSSETIMMRASDTSESPKAALCLVPKSFSSPEESWVNGKKQPAAATLSPLRMTAPSCKGDLGINMLTKNSEDTTPSIFTPVSTNS